MDSSDCLKQRLCCLEVIMSQRIAAVFTVNGIMPLSNQIVGPTFLKYFDPEKEKTVLLEQIQIQIQRRDI